MTKKSNFYQQVFGALLLLKLGGVGSFAEWSWLLVFLPLFIGSIHGYVWRLMEHLEIPHNLNAEMQNLYLNMVYERRKNKAIKEFEAKNKAKNKAK